MNGSSTLVCSVGGGVGHATRWATWMSVDLNFHDFIGQPKTLQEWLAECRANRGLGYWLLFRDTDGDRVIDASTEMFPVTGDTGDLTVTAAMARMIRAGADRIHVFGRDMAGAGYAYGDDWAERDEATWEARWKREAKHVDITFDQWRALGVSIETGPVAE